MSRGFSHDQSIIKEEYAMNTVMTAAPGESPNSEVFAITKGALDWLRNAPNPFYATPVEEKRVEVMDTIRGLARDIRDLDFEIRCADVQIHIAAERKNLLEVAIAEIEAKIGREKDRSVMKGLEASKWRTLRQRKKVLRQLDLLYREKRGFVDQIKTLKACIKDLNRIKDDPSVLAALVAEAEVGVVN
jgi:hypothetical protein